MATCSHQCFGQACCVGLQKNPVICSISQGIGTFKPTLYTDRVSCGLLTCGESYTCPSLTSGVTLPSQLEYLPVIKI